MGQPVKNNSELLYLQARQLFEEVKKKFEDGTIQTETNLIHEVFQAFEDFFVSVGQPRFTPRLVPEQGPPWSEDYNNMMKELKKDLQVLFQEMELLSKSLYSDFNHNMVQYDLLNKQFESVMDKMRDLEIYTGIGEQGVEIGRDDFFNKDKIDYSKIAGIPLEVVDGAVTLPIIERKNVAPESKITIVPGNRLANGSILGTESNGFPGNNTEVQSVPDDILTNRNYLPTFVGDSDNHGDYGAVIDGNPNTWFEYEKVNVREHDRLRVAKNLGWEYEIYGDQTVTWAEDPENGILKLNLQITLDTETIINQINCNMYTPSSYGAKPAIVKNILVSDGKKPPISVIPKNKKDDQYSFHFNPIKAKVINILFEQSHKYITDIGHIFYEQKTQSANQADYALTTALKKSPLAQRIEGPLISLEDLGIQVNVKENTVETSYKQVKAGPQRPIALNDAINRLTRSINAKTIDIGVERFEGFRWCIGIRDIEIFSCEFAEEGELVTHPFYFDKPLEKISLNVDEHIPESFNSNDAMKYQWLSYYISIDDGSTWYPITPISHEVFSEDQPPKIYTIRMKESDKEPLQDKHAYIESDYPVYHVRLKVVGRRLDNDFQLYSTNDRQKEMISKTSPVLSSYLIQAESVKEVADSEDSTASLENLAKATKPDTGLPPYYEPELPDDEIKEAVKVNLYCKRSEWCIGNPLIFEGKATSSNYLEKVELWINNELMDTKYLTGKEDVFQFTVSTTGFNEDIITAVIKAYDSESVDIDSEMIQMIDCSSLLPEDQPQDCLSVDEAHVVIDRKITTLCECETLVFYGSVQTPNPIQSILYRINNRVIDPDDLGTPPENDPCGTITPSSVEIKTVQKKTPKEMTDEELLQIEDFGEWLEAFEEREDCGCKNKKRAVKPATFQQATPFKLMSTSNEQSFYVEIPYWKLRELEIQPGDRVVVDVTVRDEKNQEAMDSFTFVVDECNDHIRDCYQLESIEMHYYHYDIKELESVTIPINMLPYEYVMDGAGTGVTIGWDDEQKAVVIMQTKGYDEADASFLIHAIGIHYLDKYGKMNIAWSESIGEKTDTVRNENKMLGEPTRSADWINEIKQGDYSTAPGLSRINDYAYFLFEESITNQMCDHDMESLIPVSIIRPDTPNTEDCQQANTCNQLTFVEFQVYDETVSELKSYKVDIEQTNQITLPGKNGDVTVIVGWSDRFKGPAIKIQSANNQDNVLLTAMGIGFINACGEAQTSWVTGVRYITDGTQNMEFVIGEAKDTSHLYWIESENIDYTMAPYVGGANDVAVFQLSEDIENNICLNAPSIDDLLDVAPEDKPIISWSQEIESICFEDPSINIDVSIEDVLGLHEVTYGITVNSIYIYGPYTDTVYGTSHNITFNLNPSVMQVGDIIELQVKAVNRNGIIAEDIKTVSVENCLPWIKASGTITIDSSITYRNLTSIDLGNFMTEWTEWSNNEAGDWTTVENGGRIELTNLKNQNGYSGWYNKQHMDMTDYYFEFIKQARQGDDDTLGAFFRIQEDENGVVTGFYSVEHDGTDSWVNGSGFRIIKHTVDGNKTIKTILSEDKSAGWTLNAHRAYKIIVYLEGNKITAELYEEETETRPAGDVPVEPYNWKLVKTLTATDDSYSSGAWGPMTNSNPSSYFWGLKLSAIKTITSREEPILKKDIDIHIFEEQPEEEIGSLIDRQLHESTVGELLEAEMEQAIKNQYINLSDIVKQSYNIVDSSLVDIRNQIIPVTKLKFVPYDGDNEQETSSNDAKIWGNIYVDKL